MCHLARRGKLKVNCKGQVIWATFSFNNTVVLQVEKRCCLYYHRMLNFSPEEEAAQSNPGGEVCETSSPRKISLG